MTLKLLVSFTWVCMGKVHDASTTGNILVSVLGKYPRKGGSSKPNQLPLNPLQHLGKKRGSFTPLDPPLDPPVYMVMYVIIYVHS